MAQEESVWRIPSGRAWDGVATPLSADGTQTNDQGCLAVQVLPDGGVLLADTKVNLADQTPIRLLPTEWADHKAAIIAGTI